LVAEDQLSLAIGRRGQNVRLASKLVGWDIEIMTVEELDESLARAETWFSEIPGMTPEATEAFITEGFLSFRDLTFFEAPDIAEIGGLAAEQAQEVIDYAEDRADEVEEEEEARAEEEREAARNAPKVAVLIEEKPQESAAKEAFDSLFTKEPASETAGLAVEELTQDQAADAAAQQPPTNESSDEASAATDEPTKEEAKSE
jgi:N utilization substance protein A